MNGSERTSDGSSILGPGVGHRAPAGLAEVGATRTAASARDRTQHPRSPPTTPAAAGPPPARGSRARSPPAAPEPSASRPGCGRLRCPPRARVGHQQLQRQLTALQSRRTSKRCDSRSSKPDIRSGSAIDGTSHARAPVARHRSSRWFTFQPRQSIRWTTNAPPIAPQQAGRAGHARRAPDRPHADPHPRTASGGRGATPPSRRCSRGFAVRRRTGPVALEPVRNSSGSPTHGVPHTLAMWRARITVRQLHQPGDHSASGRVRR